MLWIVIATLAAVATGPIASSLASDDPSPPLSNERVQLVLLGEVLKRPEVLDQIISLRESSRPDHETQDQETSATAISSAKPYHRKAHIDLRLGIPQGVFSLPTSAGVEIGIQVLPMLSLEASFDVNVLLANYGVNAQATIHLLQILPSTSSEDESGWSPILIFGVSHLVFTGNAKLLFQMGGVDFEKDYGLKVDISGMKMDTASLLLGVDYQGRDGVRFRGACGRVMQIGRTYGSDEIKGFSYEGAHSYACILGVGFGE